MKNQKVTAFQPRESKLNMASYRKESSFWKEITIIDLKRGEDVANIRFYGASSTIYCVAWFHLWNYRIEGVARGMGKAGGYGYHRPSAAMQEALTEAGFTFVEDFRGVGDQAMKDACLAIAKHLKISRPYIHIAHA